MKGFKYWTKHFDGFDVVTSNNTGESYIVSETDPDNKPMIGPFDCPSAAIEFGINRVEQIK